MQRAVRYRRHVGVFHVLGANAGQHLAVNLDLAVGIVIVGAGLHAQPASYNQGGEKERKAENDELGRLRHVKLIRPLEGQAVTAPANCVTSLYNWLDDHPQPGLREMSYHTRGK